MNLDDFLCRHGVVATRHEHPAVMTVEESERLVPKLPGAKTKNLFLRDRKGRRHFLVTAAHDRTIRLDALWDADAVQAHPLVNTATMVIPHASLERFLSATWHPPRVVELPAAPME